MGYLSVFGCMVYVYVLDGEWWKFDKKLKKMCFVGYSLMLKGYCFLDEMNWKMYIWRDVEFNENDFG